VSVAGAPLVVLFVIDLQFFNARTPTGQALTAEAVLLAGAAWFVARRARTGRPAVAAGVAVLAAALSGLVTCFVGATVPQREPGLAGLLALLLVVVALGRWSPRWWLVAVAAPLVAVVALDQRLPRELSWELVGDAYDWLALAGLAALGWGLSRRADDRRRRAAAEQVRRAERLELARDLHDDVAHHVTAMVVLAQAGEQLAERDPAQARQLFADLERTGQEGLVAMGRVVRLLRGAGPPARTLDTVRTQVERFAGAELHLGAGVDDRRWSPELATSVQRLVQEGLTNVRKHARSATTVRVSIDQADERLVVRVRDDGARPARARFRPSGFGLVGLAERVGALGGELASGPADGGGWQLTASLPAR
jgi:signal transduction histidine kinase